MKKKVIILGISITAFILGGVLLFSGNSNGIVSFFDIPKKGMLANQDKPIKDEALYECIIDEYNGLPDVSSKTTDDVLDDVELAKITKLTCGSDDTPVEDLTGINKLTALKYLTLTNVSVNMEEINSLTALVGLTLKKATFSNPEVVPNISGLISIEVSNSNATSIDFSSLSKLTVERIIDNENLTSLKFKDDAGNYAGKDAKYLDGARLEYPQIKNNPELTSLDFSNIINLPQLDITNNKNLKEVNLTGCTGLKIVKLDDNNLSSVNVSDSPILSSLSLQNNHIASLDLSNNKNLRFLMLSSNELSSLPLSSEENNTLERLYIDNNKLTSIDLSNYKKLYAVKLANNNFTSDKTIVAYKNTPFDTQSTLTSEITPFDDSIKYIGVSDVVKINNNANSLKINYSSLAPNREITIAGNSVTAKNKGNYSFEASYNHSYYISDMGKKNESTKFNIKYNLEVVELTSSNDSYIINEDKGYIYTGTDTDADTIKGNLSVNSENATVDVADNKVTVKDTSGNPLKEFTIISVSSTKQEYKETINDGYIFTGGKSYNDEDITSKNATVTYDNSKNVVKVTYGEDIVTSIAVIDMSSDSYKYGSDGKDGYIYIGSSTFDKNKVTVTGTEDTTYEENTFTIKYNGKIVMNYTILSYKVTKDSYSTGKGYIYTKYNTFSKEDIELVGLTDSDISLEGNKLKVSYKGNELEDVDIVTYSSTDYTLGEGYVYTGKEFFEEAKISVTNGNIKYNNLGYTNSLEIDYNGTKLDKMIVITYSSAKYDFSKEYYDLGSESYVQGSVTVKPAQDAKVVYEDDKLKIKYNDKEVASIDILKYSSDTYNLDEDYIYLGNEEFSSDKITNSSNITLSEEDNSLKIMYKDNAIKTYKLLKITSFGSLIATDKLLSLENESYTYDSFKSEITTNDSNLVVKVYNADGTPVTEGDIVRGMTVNIEYNGKVLHTYKVVNDVEEEYLEFDESIKTKESDTSKKYILDLSAGITTDELKKHIDTNGSIEIKDKEGASTSTIATGYKLVVTFDTGTTYEYILVVRGDVNGDGKITNSDVAKLFQFLRKKITMDDCYIFAGNVSSHDDEIKIGDVSKLFQFIRNKIDSLEDVQ